MRFGVGVFRFSGMAIFAGLAVATVGFEAHALSDPKLPPEEGARLALIDHCVVYESNKHGQSGDYVNTCKCATKKVLGEMNQSEMQGVAKWKKPTTAIKSRWEAAWTACNQ